jgi:hypothetical protein
MKFTLHTILWGCLLAAGPAHAGLIQFDQFGNGLNDSTPLPTSFTSYDNGGNPVQALTYTLPFSGVAGDLILTDPNFSDLPLEVLIFPGDGTVQFFAGNLPNSLAFLPSPPALDSSNLIFVSDVGPEDTNFATYTPTDGQPGFDTSSPTYVIYNGVDGLPAPTATPEPRLSLAAGLVMVLGWAVRRRAGRQGGRRIARKVAQTQRRPE